MSIDMENLSLDATVVLSKNDNIPIEIVDGDVGDIEPPNMFDKGPNEELNKTFNRAIELSALLESATSEKSFTEKEDNEPSTKKPNLPPKPSASSVLSKSSRFSSSAISKKESKLPSKNRVSPLPLKAKPLLSSRNFKPFSSTEAKKNEKDGCTAKQNSMSARGLQNNPVRNNNNSAMVNKNMPENSSVKKEKIEDSVRVTNHRRIEKLSGLSKTSPNLSQALHRNSTSSTNKPLKAARTTTYGRRKSSDNILEVNPMSKPTDSAINVENKIKTLTTKSSLLNTSGKKSLSASGGLRLNRSLSTASDSTKNTSRPFGKERAPTPTNAKVMLQAKNIPGGGKAERKTQLVSKPSFSNHLSRSSSKSEKAKAPMMRTKTDSALLVAERTMKRSKLASGNDVFTNVNPKNNHIQSRQSLNSGVTNANLSSCQLGEAGVPYFDGLVLCVQNLDLQNEKLKSILSNREKRIDDMELEIKCLQEQKVQSEKDFNLLLGELGKDIEMMCAKHAEEKSALSDVHQSQLDSLMHDNSKKIEYLNQRHADEVNQFEKKRMYIIEEEKSKFVDELSKMSSKYEARIKLIEAKHRDEVQTLKLKNTEMKAKLSDLVDNIQDSSSSQYVKEMQQELESLKAVLDIRNNELRSLRMEKEDLTDSVASLNESQVKINNLTCQVEDLRELLELKRSNERRLDSEVMKLEENIRSQTKEKNQLFREKEQLQWKIKEKMSMDADSNLHSHSFSGVTDHGNFKTYTFQHSSLNCTAPADDGHLSIPDASHVQSPWKQPTFSSTPTAVKRRT